MSKNVVILGAGGHAKVIADIIIKNGDKLIGFLDDNKVGTVFLDYSVIGKIDDTLNFPTDTYFIVGIGSNQIRKLFDNTYHLLWYKAIHPFTQIADDVFIDDGTTIMANAVINSSSVIGRHCIVNTGAIVEHDNILENYVHVSPNATLCGTVKVGELSHIGAGSTIINNIDICTNVIVGAGAVVVKDLPANCTAVGAPARAIKFREII